MDFAKLSRFPVWQEQPEGEPKPVAPTAAVSTSLEFVVFSPSNKSVTSLHQSLKTKIVGALQGIGATVDVQGKLSPRSLSRIAASIRQTNCLYIPLFGEPRISLSILGYVILGRFYRKPVIVHLINQEQSRTSIAEKFAIRMSEQLADKVLLTTTEEIKQGKYFRVDFLAPVADDFLQSHTELQPRIATVLDADSLLVLPIVCKAFAVVKQKYPRAELVLLYNSDNKEAHNAVAEYDQIAGITLFDISQWKTFRGGPVSADMVLDFSSFGEDRTTLLTALAEGLPVISFVQPGTESLLHDGVEGIVISRLDRSFIAGRIIRLIESPEVAAALSREAVRLARRFSPSHLAQQLKDILAALSL